MIELQTFRIVRALRKFIPNRVSQNVILLGEAFAVRKGSNIIVVISSAQHPIQFSPLHSFHCS